jgi:hypothetical protein
VEVHQREDPRRALPQWEPLLLEVEVHQRNVTNNNVPDKYVIRKETKSSSSVTRSVDLPTAKQAEATDAASMSRNNERICDLIIGIVPEMLMKEGVNRLR